MVHSIQRDQRRRLLAYKFMLKWAQYRTILQDSSLPLRYREQISLQLCKIPRNASMTRIRNRCVATGRGRGILRFCKLSRILLRKMASQTLLTGVNKSSW